ncbi:RNA-directed DNA polymerase, eukaryota [Tanacetum coccineum]
MESFHLSFQRVVDVGMFKGIKLSQSLSLSHMFYADDAVFVGQWSDGNINTLIPVLDCFYSASGLRINMSKSKIMGVNVEDEKVKYATSKLGCLTLKSPFLYLGTKVGATMSRVSDWKEVVEKAIHGEDENVDKAHYIGGRTCWTSIVHEVKVLCSQGVNILDYMRLKLGDGENTNFWKDNWCSEGILKDLFPRLYALELCKLVNVCTKLNDPRLVEVLYRTLSMRSAFRVFAQRLGGLKYVSIKVNVLAWKIKIDGLPTRFKISRRGIDIHSILCPVCDGRVESSEHLFFGCHLSKQITRKVSLWWNVAYVDVNSYAEWYSWIVSLRIAAKSKLMLEGVFYTMWWQLWTYRNKLLFDDKVPSKMVIFDSVVSSSFYGCRFRSKASFSWNEWLKNPYLIVL